MAAAVDLSNLPANIDQLFITLDAVKIGFLFLVGFIGGLVSGFIGSGGAFVLTPGMMSLGVPAAVAVASNMCHKFPKALVGAYRRFRYGQVDLKLGLIVAATASLGVLVGIRIQEFINDTWGEAGSNLYVSLAFVVVLTTVGSYVFMDAIRTKKRERMGDARETRSSLAQKLARLNLPPMIDFKGAGVRMSLWFTVPVGFLTGLLAATIAVGGFIGVPGMIYVIGAPALVASATELAVAGVMGLTGSIKWAALGLIDIRMTLIILFGSLFGVQLGAIGTTYVKDYMVKYVMGTIMLIVAVSRAMAVPEYLVSLNLTQMSPAMVHMLTTGSFIIMCLALVIGAAIILGAMFKGRAAHRAEEAAAGYVKA